MYEWVLCIAVVLLNFRENTGAWCVELNRIVFKDRAVSSCSHRLVANGWLCYCQCVWAELWQQGYSMCVHTVVTVRCLIVLGRSNGCLWPFEHYAQLCRYPQTSASLFVEDSTLWIQCVDTATEPLAATVVSWYQAQFSVVSPVRAQYWK